MVLRMIGDPVENWMEVFEAIIEKIKVVLDEMDAEFKTLLGENHAHETSTATDNNSTGWGWIICNGLCRRLVVKSK